MKNLFSLIFYNQAVGEESFREFNAANSENNTNSLNNSDGFITTPTENSKYIRYC